MGLPFCLRWSRKAALLRGRLSGDQKEEENHCRWKEQQVQNTGWGGGAMDTGQDPPHTALLTELPRWATSWQGPAGRPGHQPALPPRSVCLC